MNKNIITIRFIAILLVVLGHSIILYDYSWGVYMPDKECNLLATLKYIINLIQMPLFFSLSGYLFYGSVNKYTLRTIITKKFKRLIIPYIFICYLWMDPIKFILQVPHYDINCIDTIIKHQIIGINNGHLWYLYTLFAIFILFTILHCVNVVNNSDVFSVLVIPIILFICSIYSNHFGFFSRIATYSLFFYIGFILNKYSSCKLNFKYVSGILLSSILIFVGLLYYSVLPTNIAEKVIGILIIILLYRTSFKAINDFQIVKKISDCSFGIYLFHSPMIYFTFTYFKDSNPLIILFINFFLFGFLAIYITKLIKNTKLRFIIGE